MVAFSLTNLISNPGYNASYPLLIVAWGQSIAASPRGAMLQLGFRDNAQPRELLAKIEASGKLKPATIEKLKRRLAAHQNCLEGLPMLVAAVVAGNSAGLDAAYMNKMVLAYVLSRFVFVHMYIKATTQRASLVRSLAWWAGNACWIMTLIKAGSKLNA